MNQTYPPSEAKYIATIWLALTNPKLYEDIWITNKRTTVHVIGDNIHLTRIQKSLFNKGAEFAPSPHILDDNHDKKYIINSVRDVYKSIIQIQNRIRRYITSNTNDYRNSWTPKVYKHNLDIKNRIISDKQTISVKNKQYTDTTRHPNKTYSDNTQYINNILKNLKQICTHNSKLKGEEWPTTHEIGATLLKPITDRKNKITVQPINLNKLELKELIKIKNNKDIITAKADKNMGITIIDKMKYINLMDQALSKSPQTFQRITNNNIDLDKDHTYQNIKHTIIDLYCKRYKHLQVIRQILKQNKVTWKNKGRLIRDISIPILARQRIKKLPISLIRQENWTNVLPKQHKSDHIRRFIDQKQQSIWIQRITTEEIPYPILKGLPKMHKNPIAMRLVVPFNKHILNNIHVFLAKTLEHITIKIPLTIQHSVELINRINNQDWEPDDIIFKADVISLYPNINLPIAIKQTAELLANNIENDTTQLNMTEWQQILDLAHQDLEFYWNGNIWFCKNGVPIGSPCGPHIATIALQKAIQENIKEINQNCKYYAAYLDDHFGISKTRPEDWINKLIPTKSQPYLSFDPPESIILKKMVEEDLEFSILDVKVKARTTSTNKIRLYTDVYTKPIGVYQYLHWTSSHTTSVKIAIPMGEITRRTRIINDSTSITPTRKDLILKLYRRGYPNKILKKSLTKKSIIDAKLANETLLNKIQKKKTDLKFPWNNEEHDKEKEKPNTPNKVDWIWPIVTNYNPRFIKSWKRIKTILNDKVIKLINKNKLLLDRMKKPVPNIRTLIAFKRNKTIYNIVKGGQIK